MSHAVKLALLNDIMQDMAKDGIIFQNEAQFQFELAWRLRKELEEKHSQYEVYLERWTNTVKCNNKKGKEYDKKIYTDIVVFHPQENCIAIELKYKTKILPCDKKACELTNQAAQDLGRYDYFVDLCRNEQLLDNDNVKGNLKFIKGYAIFFTNDKCYWTESTRKDVMYREFKIVPTEEKEIVIKAGQYQWQPNPPKISSVGENRMRAVTLQQDYVGKWDEYSVCQHCNSNCINNHFRYLILESNKL